MCEGVKVSARRCVKGLEGFLIKMQTLDDTIIDFTPLLPKRCVQDYYRQFFYQPVDAQCYVDGCHRPLMSVSSTLLLIK